MRRIFGRSTFLLLLTTSLIAGCSRQAVTPRAVTNRAPRSQLAIPSQTQLLPRQPANLLRIFGKKVKKLSALAFSPDGSTLFTWGNEYQQWNVETGALIQSVKLPKIKGNIHSAVFSLDNTMVASIYEDEETGESTNQIYLWDSTGSLLQTFQHSGVRQVAFKLDSWQLFSTSEDFSGSDGGNIKVWNLATNKLEKTFGSKSNYSSLAFSIDNERLLTGEFSYLRLWQLKPAKVIWSSKGRDLQLQNQGWAGTPDVRSVAFSPDGLYAANAGNECPIRLWSLKSGQLKYALGGSSDFVDKIAFSPDGRVLASENNSQSSIKIELWDMSKRKIGQTLKGAMSPFVFSPDRAPGNRTIATWNENGEIQLWKVTTNPPPYALETRKPKNATQYDTEELVSLRETSSGRILWTKKGYFLRANWSTDHRALVVEIDDELLIWRENSELQSLYLPPHPPNVGTGTWDYSMGCLWSPDKKRFLVRVGGSGDNVVDSGALYCCKLSGNQTPHYLMEPSQSSVRKMKWLDNRTVQFWARTYVKDKELLVSHIWRVP